MIDLYTKGTPNGQKISIALEELGLEYRAQCVDIMSGEQLTDEFLENINPNGKIPAIIDHDGPDGKDHRVFESGAILLYLAEKTGKLLPSDPIKKSAVIQWLFWQNAGLGPMSGQFGHFYVYGGKDACDHPYPLGRYKKEVIRLLNVLEKQLEGKDYIVGKYSIADISTVTWIGCLDLGYQARDELGLDNYPNINAWFKRCSERPAVQRGIKVCGF